MMMLKDAFIATWFKVKGERVLEPFPVLGVLMSTLPKDQFVERPPGTYRTSSSHMALA